MRRWTDGSWEDGIPRVVPTFPGRADMLKALGNAVCPPQAFPIFKAIMEEMEHER